MPNDPMGQIGGQIGKAASAASGATPWGAAIQGGLGAIQTIGGWIQQHKATKEVEKLANSYQPNSSIMDFYSKALNRYNVNPYTSSLFKSATQGAQKSLATGLNDLQSKHSTLAGIGSLVQQYNDSALKAAATAEGQQSQALGQLGQATGLKAQEEKYPFEMKYNLLASKASGSNQIMNAGISNIFGSGSSASQMELYKKLYGQTG